VSLGEVLQRSDETVAIEPEKTYREVSVRLWGKGVVQRQELTGAEIASSRRFVARAGQFIISRIDARNGASGIVPAGLDGAVVTNDFPLFSVRSTQLSPDYLGWLSKTNDFVDICRRASEGTTNRVRLQEARFLKLRIPLPPFSEQRRIVARIEELAAKVEEAFSLHHQVTEETDALVRSSSSALVWPPSTPVLSLRDIAGENSLRNGKSVKPAAAGASIRCLTLSSMRRGRIDMTRTKPVPLTTDEAEAFLVNPRDVFIVRGNGSKKLCGLAGLVDTGETGVIFPDLFIKVELPPERLVPEYFVAIWNSPATRDVVTEKAKTTSGIWKINQGHILSTSIPVPSIPEQRRIVAYLDSLQTKADELKKLQAETQAELDALLPSILDRAFKGEL